MFLMLTTMVMLSFTTVHPVHASLSEVQWNAETNFLEVSLRLEPSDAKWILETSDLHLEEGKSRPAKKADAAKAYLSWHLSPSEKSLGNGGDGKSSKLKKQLALDRIRWVGSEMQKGYEWWYFEIRCDQRPRSMHCSILMDREKNYIHRMNVRRSDQVLGVDFTIQAKKANLDPQ